MFADALRDLLDEDPSFVVASLADADAVRDHLDAATPTVLILEQRDDQAEVHPLPVSPSVAVILISHEGADVQIALRQLDPHRLRAAIGLAEQAAHPKVISLTADRPSQPPFVLPYLRHDAGSALAPVTRWLDLVFAHALDRLAAARGEAGGGWSGECAEIRGRLAGTQPVTDADEAAAFQSMADAPLWQQRLFRTFGLDPTELRLLALAAAPDLDQRYGAAIGLLQNNYAEPRPTSSTLARLLSDDLIGADIDAVLTGRRLFARFRMIRPAGRQSDGPAPGFRAAPSMLDLMLGQRRRTGAGWRVQSAALPAEAELAADVARLFERAPHPMMALGPGPGSRADELAAAILASGRPVLRFAADRLEDGSDSALALIDAALAARLHDAVLMIEGLGRLDQVRRRSMAGVDLDGLTVGVATVGLSGSEAGARSTEAVPLTLRPVDARTRQRRWAAAARDHGLAADAAVAERLAAKLRYGLSDIDATSRLAAARAKAGDTAPADRLMLDAARQISIRHAPDTVRRPPCVFGWSDIVLPAAIAAQVRAVPDHVVNGPQVLDDWGYARRLSYGRGVGALFSGPSGTGKTMAAQVIARALGVDLMQVELSRCISKYIGETEKNIDACFAAAEASSSVLLFDEADAMFGKRTEIKTAHDRNANVEVAYLLQRIEAFEGLVILTTNLKVNIDPAFLRRLRFVVDFPMPGEADRAAIWDRAIPPEAPCAPDVDVSFLARRLELSGGSIQSIAVNAAFAAAGEDGPIAMRHIMAATRAELLKMGMFTAERSLPDPVPVPTPTHTESYGDRLT
ncbi:MAG: ATP-binding protein [Pseudomonadota bacterium]